MATRDAPGLSVLRTLSAVLLLGLGAAPLAAGECGALLELPKDRDFLRCEQRPDFDWEKRFRVGSDRLLFAGRPVRIRGLGEIELTVALLARDQVLASEEQLIQLATLAGEPGSGAAPGDLQPLGKLYSKWLKDPDSSWRFDVLLHRKQLMELVLAYTSSSYNEKEYVERALADVRVVITLRRRSRHPCAMNLWVTGDAGGEFSGDVAYYNVFAQGVGEGAAAGTWADPEMQEMLKNMVEGAAKLGDTLKELGIKLPDGSEPSSTKDLQAAGNWAEEMRTWGGEMKGSDTFGLTLVDVKFDSAAPAPGAPRPPIEGFLQGIEVLGSTVHLTISGRYSGSTPLEEGKASGEDAWFIEPSTVTAGVGVRDGNLEGVLYYWEPGKRGGASAVVVHDPESDTIQGVVAAELYPKRPNRELKGIEIMAAFTAQKGALACQ